MYYIENNDKQSYYERIFKKVKIQNNILKISINENKTNDKKIVKLAQKTDKILKKCNSNKLILSKKIFKNDLYKNLLYPYGYEIVDGKWLFEALLYEVINYIVRKKEIKKEKTEISILVNDLSDYTLENIKIFSKEFKVLNIVTNHLEKFNNIEKKIYEENGIMMTVTNNKRKSLSKSQLIINIDFPNEILNKYNIFENAIIINIYHKGNIKKKRFSGTVINDYEISVNSDDIIDFSGKIDKYYLKHLYEAEIYHNITYFDFRNIIKKDNLKIKELYSKNGTM